MIIKDVIKISAELLGKANVLSYLENSENVQGDALSALNDLTACANLVINELACSYIPTEKSETATATEGKIFYSSLSETALEILSVTAVDGSSVRHKIKFDHIETDGTVNITYKYMPSNLGLTDTVSGFTKPVSARVLAYGTVAEYCLIIKSFDESVSWHERYLKGISELTLPKTKTVKGREWA